VSQQEFLYFDPEQETVYQPRDINRDLRELPEQTVDYVTPEQSMLKGEKLIPTRRTKSHANWIATAIFLLMILIGGLIWALPVRREYVGYPQPPSRYVYPLKGQDGPPQRWPERHPMPPDREWP
jgi:hypothetical protein